MLKNLTIGLMILSLFSCKKETNDSDKITVSIDKIFLTRIMLIYPNDNHVIIDTFLYDEYNRLKEIRETESGFLNEVTTFIYNEDNSLHKVESSTRFDLNFYYIDGKLSQTITDNLTPPDTTSYYYDDNGDFEKIIHNDGQIVDFKVDEEGNLLSKIYNYNGTFDTTLYIWENGNQIQIEHYRHDWDSHIRKISTYSHDIKRNYLAAMHFTEESFKWFKVMRYSYAMGFDLYNKNCWITATEYDLIKDEISSTIKDSLEYNEYDLPIRYKVNTYEYKLDYIVKD